MADFSPPDGKNRAGSKRGGKSGKVADFRYKRPAKPNEPKAARAQNPRVKPSGPRSNSDRGAKPANRPPAPKPFNQPGPRPGQAYAALDLGTNNCRLLIARPSGDSFTVIDAFSRVVRLGEGLAKSGRLSDAAMDRTVQALSVCAEKLRRRNVYLARSVATEACRRAANGEAFIARVREETGIALDIISAEEEARLAVLGCQILLEPGTGPAIIFDIGGGSTELVLLEQGSGVPEMVDWLSVPWGVVSLTDTVGRVEGTAEERAARYAEMRRVVRDSFAAFADRIAPAAKQGDLRLLGTSGTVTTLASLHLGLPQYDRNAVDGLIVPAQSMRVITGKLAGLSPEERSEVPCIGRDRAELVVAGCAILDSIIDIWPATRLGVADRGIREGILRSLMAHELAHPHPLHENRPAWPARDPSLGYSK
ncbi:Ppx/GppA family phosphatase [Altererythrobacter sp. BO-6]|uniref:Ppx/GppA phosphatase family protein n=1 Tax=Altererythrobacter sp. BO-6 TaxID=2604537 RepID=UPI0013E1E96E|nr:Ppx/GppA phosphatase family protein [Altererythrobacter sp. BO-6]QIG53825.1 Ppx/GppA family phosphatase [Altererythrobacter sp. BO-6]